MVNALSLLLFLLFSLTLTVHPSPPSRLRHFSELRCSHLSMDQAQGGVQQPAARYVVQISSRCSLGQAAIGTFSSLALTLLPSPVSMADEPLSSCTPSHPTRHSTEGYSPRFLDVDSQICEELNGRLEVNAPNFVEKHFPVPSNIIDRIYRISTTSTPTVPDPVYSATRGGWRGLVEPAVYPDNVITITRLFKLIAYICTQDTGSTPIYWRLNPRPQQGPSVNAPVSSMRPTLAATTIKQDFGVVDYRRTHVVVEIDGEQAVKSGVERVMLVHLYQMLSLSPDRRFAFGITISKDAQMRIYMASRSGVVGSQLIDFNKVRVFATMSEVSSTNNGVSGSEARHSTYSRHSTGFAIDFGLGHVHAHGITRPPPRGSLGPPSCVI